MISALVFLIYSLAVDTSLSYPQFHGLSQHHPPNEMFTDPDATNYITSKNNDAVHCNIADTLNAVDMEDLQDIIERMAAKNGVFPHMILKKLQRRMKNKEEIEDNMINALDSPPPNFFSRPDIAVPPVIRLPPGANRAPYYLPENDDDIDNTEVVFVPVNPSNLPMGKLPENKHRSMSNMAPMMGKMTNMLPGVFLSPRGNHPKPLSGATIRVNSGDPHSPIGRDVMVAVSPLMTLIEALRQAENKYQNVMGVDHDTDIFSFAHSKVFDCYVVDNVDNVVQDEDSGWKVTITDRDGKLVYDNFCLPSGSDNIIKPGTLISLTYVPINI